jgi:hypothetical protein
MFRNQDRPPVLAAMPLRCCLLPPLQSSAQRLFTGVDRNNASKVVEIVQKHVKLNLMGANIFINVVADQEVGAWVPVPGSRQGLGVLGQVCNRSRTYCRSRWQAGGLPLGFWTVCKVCLLLNRMH